jgi:hypothetical protein
MVRQEHPMSCGAACALQLLLDAGVDDVTEADIRERAGFAVEQPIWAPDLARALSELHPGVTYEAQSVTAATFDAVCARGAFIALLKTPRGKHYVIVDEGGYAAFDGVVHIRDPAGAPQNQNMGAEAVMHLEKFHKLWELAIHYAVYRRA